MDATALPYFLQVLNSTSAAINLRVPNAEFSGSF